MPGIPDFISGKPQQKTDRSRIGPWHPALQQGDHHQFDRPVRQKLKRVEMLGLNRKMLQQMPGPNGHRLVRVLCQLVACQPISQMREGHVRRQPKAHSGQGFKPGVNALDDQTGLEKPVPDTAQRRKAELGHRNQSVPR